MNARRHSLTRYLPPSSDPAAHFRIARGKPHHRFEDLPCLLARAWADGKFELLSPAWDALGYSAQELAERCVCELVALEPDPARVAVVSLLTEGSPLEFGLRRKDGREVMYHWARQFDDYSTSMFILGDQMSDMSAIGHTGPAPRLTVGAGGVPASERKPRSHNPCPSWPPASRDSMR